MDLYRCQIIVPVALLFFGAGAILLLTVPTKEFIEPPEDMFGIVLDAGSSHTSMYIYKWPADKLNGTGVVTQHSECHVKGGGISSYTGQRGAAGRSLEGCLQQAERDIPQHRHSLTPVYLGATAGMRLLNISNPVESALILQEVSEKIRSYPFSFQGATIISGREEGAYGWVTVNYLQENFIKYGFVGQWLDPGKETVGALDLGGASTQITFVTQEEVEDDKSHMKLRLYGRDYSLYTHSYLCYGKGEVLRKILAHLVKSQGVTGPVYHPCYPAGVTITMEQKKVFESPCTMEQRPKAYKPDADLTFHGTGDYHHCLGNVSEIVGFNKCNISKCSFNSVFQPDVTGSFMAFSAFFYTHSFLQRSTGMEVNSPAQLEQAAQTICNMSSDEMLRKLPDQKKYLQDSCAVSVYMRVLLLNAYKFNEHSFPRIYFQKRIGDASIGWALGYMLSLSSLLPEESVGLRKALLPGAWIGLLVLLTLLITAVMGYLTLQTCFKKKSEDSVC
ncbi:ectonucleoside triphosphate diphosphohydrolase 2 [Chanos chanos]|uniref:Ectonucleoside triphosphate diphosphohydrolase 2 n=1 Tax=Chanos chanos TaxID=29144 RepID=A0A6J2UTK3_CHACN|nr:ectonucleoside triphosphate diphosphohydrolase 2-like [Chanos chanos]